MATICWMSPKRLAKKALLGAVFGDGYLGVNNQNRVLDPDNLVTAKMCIGHSEDQLEYLLWKMQLLFPLVGDFNVRLRCETRKDGKSGKWFLWAETRTSKYLRHIHKDCYIWNGSKFQRIVKMNVLRRMTPLSLAIWFMDDGGFESHTSYVLRLSTQRYGQDGSNMIAEFFRETYKIDWVIKSGSNNDDFWLCTRNREESQKFIDLVKPFIHLNCMNKIDHSFQSMKHVEYAEDKDIRREEIVRSLQQCGEVIRNYNPSQSCKLKLVDWKKLGFGTIGKLARIMRIGDVT